LVAIEARGCQWTIAEAVIARDANDLMAVEASQFSLAREMELFRLPRIRPPCG
jgi:hypothetical protein